MNKVIGVALVAAVLAAMLPASASAFDTIGGGKGCKPTLLRPCPNTMPPSSSGNNNGWTRGGGSGSRASVRTAAAATPGDRRRPRSA